MHDAQGRGRLHRRGGRLRRGWALHVVGRTELERADPLIEPIVIVLNTMNLFLQRRLLAIGRARATAAEEAEGTKHERAPARDRKKPRVQRGSLAVEHGQRSVSLRAEAGQFPGVRGGPAW